MEKHVKRISFWLLAFSTMALCLLLLAPAYGQTYGTLDNFDCFNNTAQTAEGFEIDVEGISSADLTRTFGATYMRYGNPTVTDYDHTATGGKKGVLITWAATYSNGAWVTQNPDLGSGTPFVKYPQKTNGESCWRYGTLGVPAYMAAGCDHFGISMVPTAVPTNVTYHWKIPDPSNVGALINYKTPAAIPQMPVFTYTPPPAPAQPAVVHVVAQAPPKAEGEEPQFGDAVWVRNFTIFYNNPAVLDNLQANQVPVASNKKLGIRVLTHWSLLQKPPDGTPDAEKEDAEDDAMDGINVVNVTHRYEYYAYAGAYDPESHEAMCGGDGSCSAPTIGLNGTLERGKFLGHHFAGFNVPPPQ